MLDGDNALQTELGEGAVGDAAGRAVCEVSRAAFLSPHALPRPRIVGMREATMARGWWLRRERENGDGRVGLLERAACDGRVVAGERTRAHAHEGEKQCH